MRNRVKACNVISVDKHGSDFLSEPVMMSNAVLVFLCYLFDQWYITTKSVIMDHINEMSMIDGKFT